MRCVIIESPYAASAQHTVAEHEAYARACLLDSLQRGEAPLASHLLYTCVLNRAGFAWRKFAEETIFYVDLGWSEGMKYAFMDCRGRGFPTSERHLADWSF
jgi:hypothetical protein